MHRQADQTPGVPELPGDARAIHQVAYVENLKPSRFSEEHARTAARVEGLEQQLITMHDQGRVGSAAYDGAIAVWNAERDRLAKIAEAAISIGFNVRQQQLSQETAGQLASVVRGVLTDLG